MAQKTPVGDMPRMVPDRDDIRQRNVHPPERRPVPKSAPEPKPAGTSWVMVTLLIVAGVAIGYLALQQYSLTQLLNSYEERLELADDRIVYLEQSLTQTDESVALNGTAINAQFKAIKDETDLHMSEIRKLWDVTNKRNRQWIEDNQKVLSEQEKSLGLLSANLKTLETTQDSDEAAINSLTGQLDTEKAAISNLKLSMTDMTEELGTVNRAISSLMQTDYDERLLTLTLTQETLLAEQGQIGSSSSENKSQIDDILKSIESIDSSRLETNKRLNALLNQLETLDSRVTALTGSSP